MKKISELHFRVCDKGLFLPVSRRLAREAGKVTYWTPAEKSFPTVHDLIGSGFPDLERVECWLEDIEDVDCFVFPDVGMAGVQWAVRAMGIPVWGAFSGDELELSRGKFLETLGAVGLPVPKYEKIKGITALREHLADQEDRWVKISQYRGDLETFHWRGAEADANALDRLAAELGPFRDQISFYVFAPIEADIEDGCDTWCIDGVFPEVVIHGMEAKDKAYLGTFQRYADLPEEVRKVNDAFVPVLEKYGYRSFFSTEIRITPEGESYFIDPTCRAGSPPSQAMTEMIGNYAEMIWRGAQGECVSPEPAAKFAVQALCDFKREPDSWTYVKLNDELDRWVKSSNALHNGEVLCLPPNPTDNPCQDWLVGIGDTIAEAISHLKHNAKLLPDGASCEFNSLAELLREVEAAESQGMEFTPQSVPAPETVVRD